MNYDVDYFINKFESIPEENWCVGMYESEDGTKHCAAGHCGEDFTNLSTRESDALADIIELNFMCKVASLNDGLVSRFNQPDPKSRVLAALYEVKKFQS